MNFCPFDGQWKRLVNIFAISDKLCGSIGYVGALYPRLINIESLYVITVQSADTAHENNNPRNITANSCYDTISERYWKRDTWATCWAQALRFREFSSGLRKREREFSYNGKRNEERGQFYYSDWREGRCGLWEGVRRAGREGEDRKN